MAILLGPISSIALLPQVNITLAECGYPVWTLLPEVNMTLAECGSPVWTLLPQINMTLA